MADRPLILTALLEESAQEHFDDLRRRHFPSDRNHLAAHLTLFHHLPGDQESAVDAAVAEAADRPPLTARVSAVRLL
ncbi:MAG: 2'-5' RNA ligase family protein, partial [Pseudonocardia sediminis]